MSKRATEPVGDNMRLRNITSPEAESDWQASRWQWLPGFALKRWAEWGRGGCALLLLNCWSWGQEAHPSGASRAASEASQECQFCLGAQGVFMNVEI